MRNASSYATQVGDGGKKSTIIFCEQQLQWEYHLCSTHTATLFIRERTVREKAQLVVSVMGHNGSKIQI